MFKDRVVLLFLVTIAVIFLLMRGSSIAGHLKPILGELADMVYYKRIYSYDQKMLDLRGDEYRAIMTIRDGTSQNAIIYSDFLDFSISLAQSMLYPRKVYCLEEMNRQQLGDKSYIYQNHQLSKL
jgi:hypothetical protein